MMRQYPFRLLSRHICQASSANRLVSSRQKLGRRATRFLSTESPLGAGRTPTDHSNGSPRVNPLPGDDTIEFGTGHFSAADAMTPVVWDERRIRVELPDRPKAKPIPPFDVPNFWLRDHCRCKKCVNQDTMQRAFDTFQLSYYVHPKQVRATPHGLDVTWMHDGISEEHSSFYSWEWLRRQRKPYLNVLPEPEPLLWGKEIALIEPVVHYDEVMADEKGVGEWTAKIKKYGFCYVEGCPVSPEKTKELLERIAFIRVTHYGGFYDFTSDLTMKDTAYTSLALGPHTDTTYFTDPAGLQMFHLLSHTEGEGGASLLVDGFRAASIFRNDYSRFWYALASTPIRWHASGNEGITITPAGRFPVLTCQQGVPPGRGKPTQIRWNNDDRASTPLRRGGTLEWYEAAKLFDKLIKSDENQYWAQLKPGRPLIFDNWRILHGRSAFTGKRRICGGYINHDDYISRWKNTNFSREEIMSTIL